MALFTIGSPYARKQADEQRRISEQLIQRAEGGLDYLTGFTKSQLEATNDYARLYRQKALSDAYNQARQLYGQAKVRAASTGGLASTGWLNTQAALGKGIQEGAAGVELNAAQLEQARQQNILAMLSQLYSQYAGLSGARSNLSQSWQEAANTAYAQTSPWSMLGTLAGIAAPYVFPALGFPSASSGTGIIGAGATR
jgi:hypothetical protein